MLAGNCRNLMSLVMMNAVCPAIALGANDRISDIRGFVERAGKLRFFKFATCKQQRLTPALLRAACQSRSLERLVIPIASPAASISGDGGGGADPGGWDDREFHLHLLELEGLKVGASGNRRPRRLREGCVEWCFSALQRAGIPGLRGGAERVGIDNIAGPRTIRCGSGWPAEGLGCDANPEGPCT